MCIYYLYTEQTHLKHFGFKLVCLWVCKKSIFYTKIHQIGFNKKKTLYSHPWQLTYAKKPLKHSSHPTMSLCAPLRCWANCYLWTASWHYPNCFGMLRILFLKGVRPAAIIMWCELRGVSFCGKQFVWNTRDGSYLGSRFSLLKRIHMCQSGASFQVSSTCGAQATTTSESYAVLLRFVTTRTRFRWEATRALRAALIKPKCVHLLNRARLPNSQENIQKPPQCVSLKRPNLYWTLAFRCRVCVRSFPVPQTNSNRFLSSISCVCCVCAYWAMCYVLKNILTYNA